jgi:hypothetical protein
MLICVLRLRRSFRIICDAKKDAAKRSSLIFWQVLWHSIVWTVVVRHFQFLIGLGAALLLNRPFPGRNVIRRIIILPWIIPDQHPSFPHHRRPYLHRSGGRVDTQGILQGYTLQPRGGGHGRRVYAPARLREDRAAPGKTRHQRHGRLHIHRYLNAVMCHHCSIPDSLGHVHVRPSFIEFLVK